MKTFLKNFFSAAMVGIVALSFFNVPSAKALNPDPMIFTIALPTDWQSSVVRQDYENESIFSFSYGADAPVFLFSVTKVTDSQWLMLHQQLSDATVVKNEGGYIYFIQKTKQTKIKGSANEQYQEILSKMDSAIMSIQFNN